jgi:hypothetical protein
MNLGCFVSAALLIAPFCFRGVTFPAVGTEQDITVNQTPVYLDSVPDAA